MSDLPSIAEVAAKFAPAPAAPAPTVTAAEIVQDESSGKGGTVSDPNVTAVAEPVTPSAEAPATEEPVVEPVKPEPKADPLSTKFAALARKERELRQQQNEYNQKMAQFEARAKELEAKAAAQATKPAPKSPLDLLAEYGFKYADATEQVIRGWKEPEKDPLDERLNPIQERLSAVDKMAQELQDLKSQLAAREQKTAYDQAMGQIDEAIESGSYEFVQALGDQARDLVRDTIVEYYNVNQKMLDYSEACDIVEKWYDENVVAPLLATAKVKSRLAPPPKPTPTQPAPTKKPERATLTNSLNSGGQATVDIDKLSKDDAIAHLAKKLLYIDN